MKTDTTDISGQEILHISDAVAREKGLDKEQILEAMESAIQKAANANYGNDYDIRASINRKTGEVSLNRCLTITEEISNPYTEITPFDAEKLKSPSTELGYVLTEELPPVDFGRVAAQSAKQVIVQKVREAERQKQYDEFKDRVGEIVGGIVRRAEFNSVTLDLSKTEAVLRRESLIPHENFRVGDRIRAYIVEVRREPVGPQIFLSRTHPKFLAKLFEQEVPEIYDKIIEIKAVARDPGSRAKMAVYSRDSNIDPIGACVGVRGSRVQAVVQELQGEKVDIIPWSSDEATFVVNALAPAEVSKIVLDEESNRFEVIVPDDQLSLAIGRRGQNVRLVTQLTGWNIDILTESEESERRNKEYTQKSKLFIEALDCDEVIARLLVAEGFSSPEELMLISQEELCSIEGFDESLATELRSRAGKYIKNKNEKLTNKLKEMGIDESLLSMDGLSLEMLVTLVEHNIKTRDDLGDLDNRELISMLPGFNVNAEQAGTIIMAARAHWFEQETGG